LKAPPKTPPKVLAALEIAPTELDELTFGDPIEATSRQPKALDEVMALYADKKWVHEPGTKWDWSISGFQLLVTILERVAGETYEEFVRQNVFNPAGTQSTTIATIQPSSMGYPAPIAVWETAMFLLTRMAWLTTPTSAIAAPSAISTKPGAPFRTKNSSARRRSE
jgi:CubicO group peptidase (beta-lactamase class C family)